MPSRTILRVAILSVFLALSGLALLQGCRTAQPTHAIYGSLANTSSNVTYSLNGGTTWSLPSSNYPTGLQPNSSVVFGLQSVSGVASVTYTWDCPGYLVS